MSCAYQGDDKYSDTVNIDLEEIIFWSHNKEDVETFISTKKYNL